MTRPPGTGAYEPEYPRCIERGERMTPSEIIEAEWREDARRQTISGMIMLVVGNVAVLAILWWWVG